MCIVCDRIRETRNGNNPYLVKELETGYAVIGDYQHFRGYSLFLLKDHVVELYELEEERRMKFFREMTIVAEATAKAFGAEKMNYECLGNGDAHLHWHLFPRRSGDLDGYGNNGKGPVWWYPREKMYAEEERPAPDELEEMKARLLKEINTLLQPSLLTERTKTNRETENDE